GRHGRLRATESLGPCLAALALQIAEDDENAVFVRQAAQLLVENRLQVIPEVMVGQGWFRHLLQMPLADTTLRCYCPHSYRGLMGDAVEPIGDHRLLPDRCRLANQHQERRLKGILGVVITAQKTPTNPPNHRTVPADQRGKTRIIPLLKE